MAASARAQSGAGLLLCVKPRLAEFSEERLPMDEIEAFYHLSSVSVPSTRPYTWSNSASTMDNVLAFADPGTDGACEVAMKHVAESGSESDWRLLQGGRMFADAILLTGETLRKEPGTDQALAYQDMVAYRHTVLQRSRPPVIVILSGSGDINADARVMQDPTSERLIVSTEAGAERVRAIYAARGGCPPGISVVAFPEVIASRPTEVHALPSRGAASDAATPAGPRVSLHDVFRYLRQERDIQYLEISCGGRGIVSCLDARLLDEIRVTFVGQIAGGFALGGAARPLLLPFGSERPFSVAQNPHVVYEGIRAFGCHHLFIRGRLVYRHDA